MTPINGASGVANGLAGGGSVGSGQVGPRHAALVAVLTEVSSDQVTKLLPVSESEMTKMLQILESPLSPSIAAQRTELFESAVSAASQDDVPRALAYLATVAALDPRHAATLASEPALASIRSEVAHLLTTLTFAAKADADARLERARQAPPAAELQTGQGRTIQPELALLFAERLIESGGYAAYVHSTELSQLVLDYTRWMPAYVEAQAPRPDRSELPVRHLLWIAAALVALLLVILSRSR